MKKRIPIHALLLLLATAAAEATSMKAGSFQIAPFYYEMQSFKPVLSVRNDSTFTAFKNEWSVRFLIWYGGGLVYDQIAPGADLLPKKEKIIEAPLDFIPEAAGIYSLKASIDYLYEVKPEDNEADSAFVALFPGEKALNVFSGLLPRLCNETEGGWAFMPPMPIAPGTLLGSTGRDGPFAVLDRYRYLAWLDCSPLARFGHETRVVALDATDSTGVIEYKLQGGLTLNSIPYLSGLSERIGSADRIFGSFPDPESIPSSNTVSDSSAAGSPPAPPCVVVVTGKTDDPFERNAFEFDADIMVNNLVKEKLGARVPAENVHRLSQGSASEIRSLLAGLRGKCSEIYFIYSGHGWKGGMSTRNDIFDQLSYWDLGYELLQTGADGIHVVVDACYSGTAVDAFRAREEDLKRKNVTVLTACNRDTTSRFNYLHTDVTGRDFFSGRFLWALATAYGDPAAESDGQPGVSLVEAFEWLRKQNPVTNGNGINQIQDPQYYVHRAVKADQPVLNPPDSDLSIEQVKALDPDAWIQVVSEPPDESKIQIDLHYSTYGVQKKWRIHTDFSGEYSVNLQFNFSPDETVPEGKTPFVFVKKEPENIWKVYGGYEWDPVKHRIKALGVDGFSEWTVGFPETSTGVQTNRPDLPGGFRVGPAFPNPFNPGTKVHFEIPSGTPDAVLTAGIYDALGRRVMEWERRGLDPGTHEIIWDGNSSAGIQMPAGVYFLRLNAGSHAGSVKLILVR